MNWLWVLLWAGLWSGTLPAEAASRRDGSALVAAARGETAAVPNEDDAADDPAIWIHPARPELSLILGTDKQGGLHIYHLDGRERGVIARESKPNNVDVLYGFELGGQAVDLALMSTRGESARGFQVWAIDREKRELTNVSEGSTFTVLKGEEPYGCCTYKSRVTGAAHAFITSKSGLVEQYLLRQSGRGKVGAEQVASFKFSSIVEACVADDELGVVYFAEEQRGIWKMPAEPDAKRTPSRVANVGEHGLSQDVEGLAIYAGRNGAGYLIVSSQGNDTFKIYERGGSNRFVGTFNPRVGKFGDVEDTDGIAVTSAPLPPLFPMGLFIAQDGKNHPARQNFKLFGWEDIAGTNLLIEAASSRPHRPIKE